MINDKRVEREQDRSQYPTTRPYLVDREETDTSIFDTSRAIDGSAEIEDMTNIHHASVPVSPSEASASRTSSTRTDSDTIGTIST
ncbi:hypothetical protein L916_10096 [Phytophthora nicotianae]|uniref:Uncharacterized protein n=1 Tax=Phytophthora nicotianae TaxID=4792 RepID=W2IY40_PHYNI|nr:hypothetical protein L916_10096 [Phytophthora nicotianae]